MNMIKKSLAAIAFIMFGAISSANAQSLGNSVPPDFPNPENVRIEGDLLVWDEVENAAGYNIYSTQAGQADQITATPLTYVTTVVGTQFPLMFTGNYSVVSFNQGGVLFSNQFASQVQVRFEEGVVGNPVTGATGNFPNRVFSLTCGAAAGITSCSATCPSNMDGVIFVATGGSCSTPNFLPINSTAGDRSYTCNVQGFTTSIRSQVYCSAQ